MTEQEQLVEEESESEARGQCSWVGKLIGWLFRMALVGVLGVALGVGLYLGVPALLRAWMEPVEANTAQIAQLQLEIDLLQESQAAAFEGVSDRVASLEGDATSHSEMIAELQSQAGTLQESLAEVEADLDQVDRIESQLGRLQEQVLEIESSLDGLMDKQAEPSDELQAFQNQLQRLHTMTLLSRARFELLRSNYGLAQENLELARAQYDDQLLAENSPVLAVIERLDLAAEALPDSPSVAAQDLEAAWRLLVEFDAAQNLN